VVLNDSGVGMMGWMNQELVKVGLDVSKVAEGGVG